MSRKINRKFENTPPPALYFLACNTGTRFQVVCIERDLKRYILYLLLSSDQTTCNLEPILQAKK